MSRRSPFTAGAAAQVSEGAEEVVLINPLTGLPIGSASYPVPVASTATLALSVLRGPLTEKNAAMTAGGTSQTLMAANATRSYLLIQNPSTLTGQNIAAAESLFVRFAASAGVNAGTSFEILPGGSLEMSGAFVSTDIVTVNAATTAHRILAVEG